ncbi:hypothetical protein LSAT2_030905, partial [Lamellibrachia satsuma]
KATTERTSAGFTDEKKIAKMMLWLTCVLLVLSAQAKYSMGQTINLQSGQISALPGNTANVEWINKPTLNAGPCKLQGVIAITPPSWAKSVIIFMRTRKPTGHLFNIGDSPTNDGYGGDYLSTLYDAELHALGRTMRVYRSDVGGSGLLAALANTVKSKMSIRLAKEEMYATNYAGSNVYLKDKGLFYFDKIYMGLNRVVYTKVNNRVGTGLCYVSISFSASGIPITYK